MAERLCYDCEHCRCDYEPDWSDATPGEGLTLECWNGHWTLSRSRGFSRDELRHSLRMAPTCADFSEAKP